MPFICACVCACVCFSWCVCMYVCACVRVRSEFVCVGVRACVRPCESALRVCVRVSLCASMWVAGRVLLVSQSRAREHQHPRRQRGELPLQHVAGFPMHASLHLF